MSGVNFRMVQAWVWCLAHAVQPPVATPARPGVNTLPVDDQQTEPLRVGQWRTDPGFAVPVQWRVSTPGWSGAHRSSDLSWQLQFGGTVGPDQLADVLEVDLADAAPREVVRQLRQDPALAVGRTGSESLGGQPAVFVDVSFRRNTTLQVIGGFKDDKGEVARFHLIAERGTTLVIDEDAPSAARFARFAPIAQRLMASMRIG